LVAEHIGRSAEVTLRAPPPLGRQLSIVAGTDGGAELRDSATVLATGRDVHLDVSGIPSVSIAEAEDAGRRTPYDERTHQLPTCFVCGPARARGDGLRIFAGPLVESTDNKTVTFAASWVPYANLAHHDGYVAAEFVWAALDCPTAYAGLGARHLGMRGD